MDLNSALHVVSDAILRIKVEDSQSLTSTYNYLVTLHGRIKDRIDRQRQESPQESLPVELIQSIFLYAHVVCDYFSNLKQIRPLTEEEKVIGDRLKDLLAQSMAEVRQSGKGKIKGTSAEE